MPEDEVVDELGEPSQEWSCFVREIAHNNAEVIAITRRTCLHCGAKRRWLLRFIRELLDNLFNENDEHGRDSKVVLVSDSAETICWVQRLFRDHAIETFVVSSAQSKDQRTHPNQYR